jgi:ketosteroid isomerase-like protein
MPMSASENKAATQAAHQAFGAGDLEGAMKDMADDIEWTEAGNSTISGTYRGKDEVARLFMTLASKSFRTEPQHFIADGDHVVVLTRTTAGGQSADQADVLTFRGGKVAKFQSAGDTALQESIWGKK